MSVKRLSSSSKKCMSVSARKLYHDFGDKTAVATFILDPENQTLSKVSDKLRIDSKSKPALLNEQPSK